MHKHRSFSTSSEVDDKRIKHCAVHYFIEKAKVFSSTHEIATVLCSSLLKPYDKIKPEQEPKELRSDELSSVIRIAKTLITKTLYVKPRQHKAEREMLKTFFGRIEMTRTVRFLIVTFVFGVILCATTSTDAQERNRTAGNQPASNALPITQWYSAIQNRSGDRSTFRDSSGRVQATATRSGNQTTFRDSSGRVVGTARTSGDRTVLRDSSGRVVESADTNRDRTTFRSSSGSNIGSATQSRNQTTFRDSSGRSIGSTTNSGSQTITRDRSGRVTGSASRSPR